MRPGIMLVTSVGEWDAALRSAVHSLASPPLTASMRGFTFLGSMAVSWTLTLALAAWLWSRRLSRDAMLLLGTMVAAEILNDLLKLAIRRPRPEPFFDTPLPGSYSFPSGHALFAICFYTTLCAIFCRLFPQYRIALQIAAGLLIAAIGLSRVYLGVHYPSDVLGGYLCGVLWVSAVRACTARLRSQGSSAGRGLSD